MTSVLLWKEYRQQGIVWYAILAVAILMALLMFGVFGSTELWYQYRHERPLIFTTVLVILATAQGVVAGALLLVEETEAGTSEFLDSMSCSRRQLFASKTLAGLIAVGSQCVILTCLQLAFGVGDSDYIFFIFGFSLDGFACGLLAGACFRSGLVAILSCIGLFAPLSWQVSLFLSGAVQHLLYPFTGPVGTMVVIATRTLFVLGTFFTARYVYCRSDFSRRSTSGLRFTKPPAYLPSDITVLLWLLFRQSRWILALAVPVCLFGSIAVAWSPFMIWPISSLTIGVIFGLCCLAPEQPDAMKFLGAQRIPAGKIWTIKVLFWFVALAVLAGLAWYLASKAPWSHYFQKEHKYFYWYTEGIGFANRLLLAAIWPLYGFCFGLFFGQLTKRPVIALLISLFFTPVITFIWVPSLMMGGVPIWWVLTIPIILFILSRSLMRAWVGARMFSARPVMAIALAAVLMMGTVSAYTWYRAVQIPDMGEPFDVAAFAAALDAAKKNEAPQLLKYARSELKAREELIEKEFSLPKVRDPNVEWTLDVPSKRWRNAIGIAWNPNDKELERWMDRLFEGQWAANAEKAAHMPLGIVIDPRQVGTSTRLESGSHGIGTIAQLFAVRALQLQAKGDSRAALDKLEVALAICRQLRNFAPLRSCFGAFGTENTVLASYHLWLDGLGPNKELLKAGLLALQKHEAAIPNPVESIKADYLISIKSEPELFSVGDDKYLADLFRLAYSMPWEKERLKGVVRAITVNRLKRMDEFNRTQLFTPMNADEIAYSICSLGYSGLVFDYTWWIAFSLQRIHTAELATAVALYHADNDKLPGKLDELVPKYLEKMPMNIFDGKVFGYRISAGEEAGKDRVELAKGQAVIWWKTPHLAANREWILTHHPIPKWVK